MLIKVKKSAQRHTPSNSVAEPDIALMSLLLSVQYIVKFTQRPALNVAREKRLVQAVGAGTCAHAKPSSSRGQGQPRVPRCPRAAARKE